jgi:Flp pilus assembly protein TadG
MSTRRKNSSGQAMVMVTMALFAMAGLMGLAVDLGWSFYVQKDAQATADSVAMAAAQEAYSGLDGNFGNISTLCTSSSTACTTTGGSAPAPVVTCTTATGTLAQGCKYAAKNGFTDGQNSQKVTIQALAPTSNAAGELPPGTTGLDYRNVHYWVRVVAVQTVPQLFSAVLGNATATVAASAVAGITGNTVPGSLILTDQPNDCFVGTGFGGSGGTECGENLDLTGCFFFCSISATGPVYLASTCNDGHTNASTLGCGTSVGANGTNYAGNAGGASVTASAIEVQSPGGVTGNFTPAEQQITASSVFLDPTTGEEQPPLTATAPIPTCGLPGGTMGAGTAGPFLYYSYSGVGNMPDGNPIRMNGNVTFSMSANTAAGCTGVGGTYNQNGATLQSGTFPTYIFMGGMALDSFFNFHGTFGPGQYVMVGTNGANPHDGNCAGGFVFCVDNTVGIMTGDSTAGTMFIFTSPQSIIPLTTAASATSNYPGDSSVAGSLYTQIFVNAAQRPEVFEAALAAPNEGGVNIQTIFSGTSLTGVVPGGTVPSSLNQYSGIVFWQDRANSTVQYNATGHVIAQINPVPPPTKANAMSIAGFVSGVTVNGVMYQPRGAYVTDFGIFSNINVTLQVISGGLSLSGALTSLTLGTPTHLLTTYTASMIQ